MLRGYTDLSEELNFFWTPLVLAVISIAFGCIRVFAPESLISCWTPVQFTQTHNTYVQQTCWNKDTYYLPIEGPLPMDIVRPGPFKSYHSLLPVIFILLIPGFKIPQFVQYLFHRGLGIVDVRQISFETDQDRTQSLSHLLQDVLRSGGIIRTIFSFLVKILICLNLLVQFIFFRVYFRIYGIYHPDKGNATLTTSNLMFPKVVLCDFKIWMLQNVQEYTVQCQMSANDYYETVIQVLFYWILVVGIFTVLCLTLDFITLMVPPLVKLRFRGVIPDSELRNRGCSVDDALMYLEDIQRLYGAATARGVADKVWQSPALAPQTTVQSVIISGDGYKESGATSGFSPDSSAIPLIETSMTEKPAVA